MKVNIEIDLKNDTEETLHTIITNLYDNKNTNLKTGQQQITTNQNNDEIKTVLCNKCKRDLYKLYDSDEAKKIINYCNVKYKGKVYCRDCQEKLGGA